MKPDPKDQKNSSIQPSLLMLTPVKGAVPFLERYFELLYRLTYPAKRISLAFLESDSEDGTWQDLQTRLPALRERFRRAELFRRDFDFRFSRSTPRWTPALQLKRRTILARSRNYLLSRALGDEDWVLWIDVDLVDYPADIIERLLAAGKDIVQPHCVNAATGETFDLNAWRDKGRRHMDDLKQEGDLVKLHAVGGTMLLVKADVHREGLVFPTFLYGKRNPLIRADNGMVKRREIQKRLRGEHCGEVETEGLGMMAHDMGYECWGMPNLKIKHWDG